MANTVGFSIIKIKISVIFLHLRSKLTLEIGPKIGGLEGRKEQERLVPTLPPFFYFFSEKHSIC